MSVIKVVAGIVTAVILLRLNSLFIYPLLFVVAILFVWAIVKPTAGVKRKAVVPYGQMPGPLMTAMDRVAINNKAADDADDVDIVQTNPANGAIMLNDIVDVKGNMWGTDVYK